MAFLQWPAFLAAQTPAPPPDKTVAAIARAWTALAAGRVADAVAAADEALKINPRDHRAIAVKVEALAGETPLAALDAYEAWLTRSGTEDIFLLQPIAVGTLEQIARGPDTGLSIEALEMLSRAGFSGARRRLEAMRDTSGIRAELALARLGDATALERLRQAAGDPAIRGEARVEVAKLRGPAAAEDLRHLLTDSAGPTRAAAARALAEVGGQAAIADLRQLLTAEQEFFVRASANVALARLGDPEALAAVNEMLGSAVADVRLMGAEAFADRGPGPWVDAILPLLQDETGLIRIRAAELVARANPDAARAALTAAAADQNPVVRSEAARGLLNPALSQSMGSDLATLRRALRDPDAAVRLRAAGGILALALRQ